MFRLYHAPDLETLGTLASRLLAQPQRDPLAPARLVVPSQGIGRWLTLQLAREEGIAMHLKVQLPASFVWDLTRDVLGALPEQSAFNPQALTWRLYDWLCEPGNLAGAERLQRYLEGGDERRRFALAAKIADVFDQYLLFRDDWLAAWERGETCDLGPDEAWQALLWRELTKDGHPHRARLLGDLLARLGSDEPLETLPERLLVFGISSLPPHHLRVLEALARHTDVVLFALNPSREAWGDIRDIRELAVQPDADPDGWYLDVGNPLLASLGKQGRDFFDTLFASAADETGFYSDDDALADDTLLHALQNDVLRLRTRHPDERLSWSPTDRSLELHVAHSPLREVEILHDQLLARFNADPTLTPDQVVVLTPDIERYAPFIEAVFAPREGAPRIPFSLADRSLRAELPLIEAFIELLALPESRFTAEEVVAWLEQPAIARRVGIEPEDLASIREWLHLAGVRWGRDAKHRAELGLPEDASYTWRQGLDRLLLGFSAPPRLAGNAPPLLGDEFPLDALEGARGQLLGRFHAFVSRLSGLCNALQAPRPLREWTPVLQQLLDELFDERESGDVLLMLSQACAALTEQADASGVERPVELALVRQQLAAALEGNGSAGGFLTGAVTFCTMVPMRSLPFRWVCLLGLDDGALPRRTPAAGFDLVARKPRRGDRARRLDDRYLFLETLLSARDGLYLSYVGRDPRNNAHLPPSVLVSELLEAVDLTAAGSEGTAVSECICIAHPLQPFASGNFAQGRRQGFSAAWHRAAQRLSQAPLAEPPAFISEMPPPEDAELTLEPSLLVHCFKHPARFLLEQRLGLRLPEAEEALPGDEPFALERPALNGLRRLALEAAERGWSEADERRVAAASGWLPTGELGQAYWGQLRGPIRAFMPTLLEERPDGAPEPLLINLRIGGVHLHGWLDGVTASGLFDYRLRDLGAWELAPFWLRHLMLNACAGPEITRESRLLSPKSEWRLGPVADPIAALEPWIVAYREALVRPLPVFPRSSHGFAQKYRNPGRKEPLDAARMEARVLWTGNDYLTGESLDPWNALAFRGGDPLDERFEALAESLYGPALDALSEGGEEE
ncbi:exodeoxyribonuclease V subunit gamma [Pseudomonas matsuisoli]|uniref:RecBCD enzyme subunit RecC n=1 Tax=Pseudomonas matsuisoli TaxID=1515666 RepID=A0A917PWV8_9PSED|nr:exodeoxyribonuclease V subunit gamma [Pseudomonas matsuisoli]GGJ96101.1 RecBCD enzyme subunit RecC [Pseudomonas matsuisoli]